MPTALIQSSARLCGRPVKRIRRQTLPSRGARLESLQAGDSKLSEAADAVSAALRGGASWAAKPQTGLAVIEPPPPYAASVKRTIHDLQARIQELILKDILLDKDEAVPPQY